jgi:hypothetical protein
MQEWSGEAWAGAELRAPLSAGNNLVPADSDIRTLIS